MILHTHRVIFHICHMQLMVYLYSQCDRIETNNDIGKIEWYCNQPSISSKFQFIPFSSNLNDSMINHLVRLNCGVLSSVCQPVFICGWILLRLLYNMSPTRVLLQKLRPKLHISSYPFHLNKLFSSINFVEIVRVKGSLRSFY